MSEIEWKIEDGEYKTRHGDGPWLNYGTQFATILRAAVEAEREACAKIAQGNVYKEHYRTWPWMSDPNGGEPGNLSNERYAVRLADRIATAIRARGDI